MKQLIKDISEWKGDLKSEYGIECKHLLLLIPYILFIVAKFIGKLAIMLFVILVASTFLGAIDNDPTQ